MIYVTIPLLLDVRYISYFSIQIWGWQKFSIEGQMENIFSFVDNNVSVTTTHLCCCRNSHRQYVNE